MDTLIIGGAMAYTFLKAQGHAIGDSLLDEGRHRHRQGGIAKAAEKGVELLLPVDTIVADAFAEDANTKVAALGEIEPGWQGLDIGPKTAELASEAIKKAKTVVWNGPVGVFEMEPFSKGTKALAELLASLDLTSIIGGGGHGCRGRPIRPCGQDVPCVNRGRRVTGNAGREDPSRTRGPNG